MLSLIGNGSLLALAAFVAVGLAAGHLLGGPNAADRLVLALSTATRHPVIALTVAKANFPDEPLLGATVLLYLLVGTADRAFRIRCGRSAGWRLEEVLRPGAYVNCARMKRTFSR